jgi:hypothetical protein
VPNVAVNFLKNSFYTQQKVNILAVIVAALQILGD